MTTTTKEQAGNLPRYLTVAALARHLGRSRKTIHAWERLKILPPRVQVGVRREWFGPTIEAWERGRLEAK
jgi:predicted DNA-binding transcriptional regulator AlpA